MPTEYSNRSTTQLEPAGAVLCNLCRADDYRVLFKAGEAQRSRIVQCNRCGLMYSNPRAGLPDFAVLQNSRLTEHSLLNRERFRLHKELRQVRDYERTRADLRAAYPRRGRLVEVGSGTGSLLACLREDGWQVEGVDPYAEACDYAALHYGLKSHPTLLENVSFEDHSVDVVVMLHVIEHMVNPAASLCQVFRMLRPGCTLVIETPRYDSLMFALLGRRERSISCPEHLYFFTTHTLADMCVRIGFRPTRLMCVGRTLSLDRLVWNLGVMSKSRTIQRALAKAGSLLGLQRVSVYVNVRDMQRAYFVKP